MKKSKKPIRTDEDTRAENGVNTTNEEFPGYPMYPATEDLMNTSEKKYEIDIENTEHPILKEENPDLSMEPEFSDSDLRSGTSADVSPGDLELLGDKNLEMDMGDDEELRHRMFPVDMEGKDLVVPGAEEDDEDEKTGSEDEENNLYSHADN